MQEVTTPPLKNCVVPSGFMLQARTQNLVAPTFVSILLRLPVTVLQLLTGWFVA